MSEHANGNGQRTVNAVLLWAGRALIAVLLYLAMELRGQVAALQKVDGERTVQVELLKQDLNYIKTALLRIENRLERTR